MSHDAHDDEAVIHHPTPSIDSILDDDALQQTSSPAYSKATMPRSKSGSRASRVRPRRVIGNYTLVSTLGSGSMGKVKLAVHNLTQDTLAVKIVPRSFATEKSGKDGKDQDKDDSREIRTIREASIMLLLHHPYIASLKEMVVLDPYYYLFMEYIGGGQLLDYIIAHYRLKEKHARRFARQIISAIDYCHRNSIVHRDLKIENILISSDGNVKIIDFGLSNLFSPRTHLSTFCGSLYFAAPELLQAKAYIGPEVDVWSFGVVLYVLVCGKVPFDDQNMAALHAKIKRGHVEYPSHLSSECKNLLSRMLVTNPNHRATVSEIIVHPWMNKGYSGPVDNHLPDRAPLTLPVDMQVIRNMTGFGFGTEQEIRQQLEAIIRSEEYQTAAKTLAQRSAELHRRNHIHLSGKKSYSLPNDDPQSIPAAYHPLVSIYYLVKERMAREQREATAGDAEHYQGNTISLPEVAHAVDSNVGHARFGNQHDPHHNARNLFARAASGVAMGKKGKTNICVDDNGHIIDAEQPNLLEGGLYRLLNRPFGRTPETTIPENESTEKEHSTVLRRLSQALHRTSMDRNRDPKQSSENQSPNAVALPLSLPTTMGPSSSETTAQSTPTQLCRAASEKKASHGESLGNKVGHLLNRAVSANHADGHPHHGHQQRRRGQSVASRPNGIVEEQAQLGRASGPNPSQTQSSEQKATHSHEQTYPQSISTESALQQGTADETVRPVFLKGLFSVSTTSTKHPSVIRADLIRVLERIGVKWRESKGRFECVHMPSIDMKRVVGSDKGADDKPASNVSVTVPDLIARFEIYIVKVPWLLGMQGLQFRRVSGDSWLYKNMCSRILAELKL